MSELIERAVEAAARAEWEKRLDDVPWGAIPEGARTYYRDFVRPTVLVALGVVADHCTTEVEWMVRADDTHPGIDKRDLGAIEALSVLAAELRETE